MPHEPQDQTGQFVTHVIDMQRNLFAYILTLVPRLNDANDVLQQTNLVIWNKRGEFEPGTDIQAWACRIAYYEVLAHRQRWRRDRLEFDNVLLDQMADEVIDTLADSDAELRALAQCSEKLCPTDRELLHLRYQETLTAPTIGQRVGRSAVAIRQALFRIREALHRCVEQEMKGGGPS
jgi:RNA polymerase sigma-70 factor (ECF subfamily)